MSQTPAPPPPVVDETAPGPSAPEEGRTTRGVAAGESYEPEGGFGGVAEAWISIAIGLIILLMFFRPIEYFFSSKRSFEQKYTFSAGDGSPLTYPQTVFFWGDIAIVAFALVLIFDGLILFTRKPRLIAAALVFTVITTLLNAGYVVSMMSSYGLQFASALAVAFGVYIAIVQWKMLQAMRFMRRAP